MTGDFKSFAKRTASDKGLRDKEFNIAKNQNMMDIKDVLLLQFINVLIKKSQGSSTNNNNYEQNEQLAEELHKPINRNA